MFYTATLATSNKLSWNNSYLLYVNLWFVFIALLSCLSWLAELMIAGTQWAPRGAGILDNNNVLKDRGTLESLDLGQD